jgi:hypothetical protein
LLAVNGEWGIVSVTRWYANCSFISKHYNMAKDKGEKQAPDLRESYSPDDYELAAGMPVRHPNRNTDKTHNRSKNQRDEPDSRKPDDLTYTENRSSIMPEELSRTLNKELFAELANHKDNPCITIYLPTHQAGAEVNERVDQVAFKQSLAEVRDSMRSKGHDNASIEKLLEPGYELMADEKFWRSLTKGLAVFICNDRFRYMKLPFEPGKQTLVNSSFLVSPLIPLMTTKEYFYLLVISKKQAKLFRADSFGMEYVTVPNLPQDMEEGLGYDGGTNYDQKAELAIYFETVDDIIWKEILHNEHVPLLLAGVEYLIPIYRSVSDYKHVYEDALTGSHERDDTMALYELAMQKMVPYFEQRTHKALELYGNQSATSLTTSIQDDIIPAAHYGQVSHLFVQKGAHIWGTFDEANNELHIHESEENGDDDLLDTAVAKTLLTGGDVYVLDKEMMPAESVVAAVLRY